MHIQVRALPCSFGMNSSDQTPYMHVTSVRCFVVSWNYYWDYVELEHVAKLETSSFLGRLLVVLYNKPFAESHCILLA